MLSLAARRQAPNRPFLAALRDLITSDPRTPDGAQIVRWTDVGAGGFVVLEPEALAALFPVWFPARSEMPWNRRRRYDFSRFVDDVLGYGFDIWDDGSDAEDESLTFTHAFFGPASGPDQFRQMARNNSYARRRMSPASERRRTLLAGAGGVVQLRRLASGRCRVSRVGETRRAQYREERDAKRRERQERARASHAASQGGPGKIFWALYHSAWAIFLTCLTSLAFCVWWRRFLTFGNRALLLVLGLATSYIGEQVEYGRPILGYHLGNWRPGLLGVATWTGVLTCLFATFGCFSAPCTLGLFVSSLSFELWRRRTIDSRMGECEPDAEDELECVPYFILIIGFAVGHWWQGRVAEGAGLFALYAVAIWLASRRVEEG